MVPPEEDSGVWAEQLRIHSYEVDFKHHATVESICRLFLEAAWSHAEKLGVGFQRLESENKYWVLSRMAVEFEQYPLWGEQVTLQTWPRDASSIFALRDFEIVAQSGRRLTAGSSAWVVLDTRSRRPQRIQSIVSSIRALPQKAALNRDPEKLAEVKNANTAMTATARYSAIDVNGHVNSARYIGWILDSYPVDFHRGHCVRKLEVNYLGETRAGEEISVLTAKGAAGLYDHSIVKSSGAELCRARLHWAEAADIGAHKRL